MGAALGNVRRHGPEGTRAWVFVEGEPGLVTVTVRDDGPAIPAGCAAAQRAARGRPVDPGAAGRPGRLDQLRPPRRGHRGGAAPPRSPWPARDRATVRGWEAPCGSWSWTTTRCGGTPSPGTSARRATRWSPPRPRHAGAAGGRGGPAGRRDPRPAAAGPVRGGGRAGPAGRASASPCWSCRPAASSRTCWRRSRRARRLPAQIGGKQEFLDAVRRTAGGDPVFTPGLRARARRVPPARGGPGGRRGAALLTDRETEVLRMVATGLSYKQIAARLVLSHRTVQNHVQNTLSKLQLHNRVELVRTPSTRPGGRAAVLPLAHAGTGVPPRGRAGPGSGAARCHPDAALVPQPEHGGALVRQHGLPQRRVPRRRRAAAPAGRPAGGAPAPRTAGPPRPG